MNIDVKGIVAIIIALSFASVMVATIVGALATGRQLTPDTANLIWMIAGGLLSVLSSCIGSKVSGPQT